MRRRALLTDSVALRVLYLLFGGLPALFFSILGIASSQAALWGVSHEAGTEQAGAFAALLMVGLGVAGTG